MFQSTRIALAAAAAVLGWGLPVGAQPAPGTASAGMDNPLYPPGTPPAPSVDSLVAEALRNNPALKAARAREEAARGGARRAGSYDPPTVGVETGRRQGLSAQHAAESMPMNGLFARQMLMFPGKVSAMRKAESARGAMQGFQAEAEAAGLEREVRDAYYDIFMLQRRLEINADNRRLLEKFVGVARAQYEAGMGRLEDILRAQTELSRIGSQDLVLRQEIRGMEAMLGALLDRVPEFRLGRVDTARLEAGEEVPLAADSLVALALRRRPDLRAMEEDLRMSKWEAAAARREAYPDLMVEGRWMAMEGPDEWSVMAGITVPVAPWSLGRTSGARAQGGARLREAENRRRAMENMAAAEVLQALAAVEAARARRDLARDATLPQAEQTLRSAEAAYRAGRTEFLMLLDAYRMLFMAREEYAMAQADWFRGRAELERAAGGPLGIAAAAAEGGSP